MDEPRPEPVYTLVYASAATREPAPGELEGILEAARRNNAAAGVTGMLLYHEGSFLQALEGDEHIVEALFERIESDPRHTDALLLFRGHVETRSFERWSMGFFRSDTATAPPALNDFLRSGFKHKTEIEEGEAARKILQGFREGRWRRTVETGEAAEGSGA